jgi:hypothetical protein
VQNGFYSFHEAGKEILNLALEASLTKKVLFESDLGVSHKGLVGFYLGQMFFHASREAGGNWKAATTTKQNGRRQSFIIILFGGNAYILDYFALFLKVAKFSNPPVPECIYSSTSNQIKMSTEARELELVGKVEMRIALAKDDKLESLLKPYLPPLLLKLGSEHAAVRNKV